MPFDELSDKDQQRIVDAMDVLILDTICKMCELCDAMHVSRNDMFYRLEWAITQLNKTSWTGFSPTVARGILEHGKRHHNRI